MTPNPNDLRGAAVMRELRVIPFEVFTRLAFKVYVPDEDPEKTGRMRTVEYRPIADTASFVRQKIGASQVIVLSQVLQQLFDVHSFLLSNLVPRPGPVNWATVPEHVRRHFRILDEQPKSKIIGG